MSKLPAVEGIDFKKAIHGFWEIRTAIRAFIKSLENAAADCEADKSGSAHAAVSATMTFLGDIHASTHLRAPLAEAVDIIQRDIGAKTLSKATQDKVIRSVAVSLQLRDGVGLQDALITVVGRDSKAAKKLEDFRNNMLGMKASKEAKELYDDLMKSLKDLPPHLPPRFATDLALTVCNAWRGKKS